MSNLSTIIIGNYSFQSTAIIGKGATGNVYQGIRIHDKYPVAIKVINLSENQNQITKILLDTQKQALKTIKSNPHIIQLLDIIQNQQFCYIITEIYKGGTLQECIKNKGKLFQKEALKIFRQIVTGYCSISDLSILHRDLKPANIVLKNQSMEPVIIDFGFCEIIQAKKVMRAFNVGSPSYMSPQAYSKTLYSEKSDIWSLGIILYEMLTGTTLDHGIEVEHFFKCLSQIFISHKLSCIKGVCKQILQQVLKTNSHQRISCHKIKYILDKDAIFKMNNKENLLYLSGHFQSTCPINEVNLIKKENNFFNVINKNKAELNTYQSVPLAFQQQKFVDHKNYSSNLTVFKEHTNLKSKLTQSRYRQNFCSPPQNNEINSRLIKQKFFEKQRINFNQNQIKNQISVQSNRKHENQQGKCQRIFESMIKSEQNKITFRNSLAIKVIESKQNSRIQLRLGVFGSTNENIVLMRQRQLVKKVEGKSNMRQLGVSQSFERYNDQYRRQNKKYDKQNKQYINEIKIIDLNREVIKPMSSNIQSNQHKFSFKSIAPIHNKQYHQNIQIQNQYIPKNYLTSNYITEKQNSYQQIHVKILPHYMQYQNSFQQSTQKPIPHQQNIVYPALINNFVQYKFNSNSPYYVNQPNQNNYANSYNFSNKRIL